MTARVDIQPDVYMVLIISKRSKKNYGKSALFTHRYGSIMINQRFHTISMGHGHPVRQFASSPPLSQAPSGFAVQGQTGVPSVTSNACVQGSSGDDDWERCFGKSSSVCGDMVILPNNYGLWLIYL